MDYENEILNLKRRIELLEKAIFNNNQERQVEVVQSNRDKTKYMFEGKVYPKNRLVLAIIKKYVQQNNVNFNQLNNVFDKSLQGSLGVVELYENALKVSDSSKRYFMQEQDVLNLANEKVVVCTQWGIFNIVKFVKRARDIGFKIEEI